MTDAAGPKVHPSFAQAVRWLGEGVWRVEHAFERNKAAGRAADDTRLRIFFVLAIFALAFATLAVEAARSALFSKVGGVGLSTPVPAEARADILDRDGRLLALDLTHYGLYLDPREIWDAGETRQGILAALPKLSAERLDKALKSNRREYLIGGLTPQERAKVHDLGLPGVAFEDEARRVYPLGDTAAHVIGFVDAGGQGLAGAEKAFDKPIHLGVSSGQPMQLALDLRVQAALQDEVAKTALTFHAQSGVGIVTKVSTGEVLGMTSWPSFDPNAPGATGVAPLTNHAMASVYELGSVFKVFTIAMGLDRGLVNLDTRFDVDRPLQIGSVSIHDHEKGDHVLTTAEVFTHSSNIGAGKIGLMAGPKVTADYFHRFGLFEAAPSELLESARPIVPKAFSDLTVAQVAFGQGISVSPLALATGMNAVFNHGRYVPLTFRKLNPGERPRGRQVVSEHTSETMLRLMRVNVTDGSGKKADAPGLRVGGKTGSAQKPENGRYGKDNISSFVAVFPTDGPPSTERYLVLITLDAPQATKDTYGFITAGWNAAPAAGRVIDRIAPFLGVERVAATPFSAPSASSTPRPE
jgi:cell division protein FtsI (penicillin-binding protein 3)